VFAQTCLQVKCVYQGGNGTPMTLMMRSQRSERLMKRWACRHQMCRCMICSQCLPHQAPLFSNVSFQCSPHRSGSWLVLGSIAAELSAVSSVQPAAAHCCRITGVLLNKRRRGKGADEDHRSVVSDVGCCVAVMPKRLGRLCEARDCTAVPNVCCWCCRAV